MGLLVATLVLAGCAQTQLAMHVAKKIGQAGAETTSGAPAPIDRSKVKVGKPYQIKGVWYYPKRQPDYDETGIASWYGEPFHGRKTANGERYDMNALTAAHKTLPLPTNVRVTNLGNGRSLMLRVNDRGPFVHGRIIDVSRRAAQLLGFQGAGTAKVRVTLEGSGDVQVAAKPATSEAERKALPALPKAGVTSQRLTPPSGAAQKSKKRASSGTGARVASRPPRRLGEGTGSLPAGVVRTAKVTPSRIFVQAGSFIKYDNANRLRARLAYLGPTKIAAVWVKEREFFRVRVGPVGSVKSADEILDSVIAKGLHDARIIVD